MRMDRILKGMSAVLTALAVVVVLTVPAEASARPGNGLEPGRFLVQTPQTAGQLEEARQKWEEARRQKEEADKKVQEAAKSQKEETVKADALIKELSGLLAEQELLKQEIDTEKQNLARAKKERDEAARKEQEQYQAMKERIRFLYENKREGYLDMFLGARTLSSLFNRREYVQALYKYDRKKLEEYQNTKNLAHEKQEESMNREAELETMKEEQKSQQETLEMTLRESRKNARQFAKQMEDAKARANAYVKLVEEQNQEIRKLENALAADNGKAGQGPGSGNRTGNQDGPASGPSTGMTKSMGGTERGRKIADYGLSFLGNPYVWGGTSLTNGADCSGFTQSVMSHFGIKIPRTADQQAIGYDGTTTKYATAKIISVNNIQPGDLVFYYQPISHVGLYIGNGLIVHASTEAAYPVGGIKTSPFDFATIRAIVRYW